MSSRQAKGRCTGIDPDRQRGRETDRQTATDRDTDTERLRN